MYLNVKYAKSMIYCGGLVSFGFAIFHILFWRLLDWNSKLVSLTSLNRAVVQILNICLTYLFFVMSYVSFFYASDMIQTSIGRTLLIAFSLFWFLRLILQIIFFGLKLNGHLYLTFSFILSCVVYLIPYFASKP